MTQNQEILIKIKADSDKALKQINSLEKQVSKFSKSSKTSASKVDAMSKSFKGLGVQLSAVAAGFISFQGISSAVTTIADFETSMKKLGAVSGASKDELKKLEDTAKHMGETTRYSATQAADGLNFLAMAGFSVDESIQALPATLNLATVGSTDLATASDIASDSLTAFGLKTEDTGRLTDVMAKTITSSNTNVEMLGASFKKVAPVATSMGVSLESTSAALGVLADAGLKAELAGTQLKIVLNRLATDKKAKKTLQELGISAYDAQGKFKGLEKITAELKPALRKLNDEAKAVALKDIFGSEAIAAGSTLINKTETLTKRVKDLNSANGEAAKIAKEMNDTLAASWDGVKSALEGLILKTSDGLTPELKKATDALAEFIRSINASQVKEFTDSLLVVADGLKGIGNAIIALNDIAAPDWLFGDGAGLLGTVAEGWAQIGQNISILTQNGTELNPMLQAQGDALAKVYEENQKIIDQGATSQADITAKKEATKSLIQEMQSQLEKLGMQKVAEEEARVSTDATNQAMIALQTSITTLTDQYGSLNNANITTKDSQQAIIDKTTEQVAKNEELKTSNQDIADQQKQQAEDQKKIFDDLKAKQLEYWQSRLTNVNTVLSTISAKESELTGQLQTEYSTRAQASQQRADTETKISGIIASLLQKDTLDLITQSKIKDEIYKNQSKAKQALAKGDFENAKKYNDSAIQIAQELGSKKEILFHKEQSLASDSIDLLKKSGQISADLADAQQAASDANIKSKTEELQKTKEQKDKLVDLKKETENLINLIKNSKSEFTIDTVKAMESVNKLQEDAGQPVSTEMIVETQQALAVIADLKAKAKQPTSSVHTVRPDASAAISVINGLKQPTSSVHTVYVRTVQTNASGGIVELAKHLPSFAKGGGFPKRSGQIPGHDLRGRDDVPSMLTRGEFVQPVRAVDYYGRDFMEAIRTMKLPKFADGGNVPGRTVNVNMTMPSGQTFAMQSDEQVASSLERYFRKMI